MESFLLPARGRGLPEHHVLESDYFVDRDCVILQEVLHRILGRGLLSRDHEPLYPLALRGHGLLEYLLVHRSVGLRSPVRGAVVVHEEVASVREPHCRPENRLTLRPPLF